MWTKITRPKYERAGQRYASDPTDAEWAVIEPHMPAPKPLGRPRGTDLRTIVDAILYMARTGCQWRLLPKDFPPFTTVQGYFYDWRDNGLFEPINFELLLEAREAAGREASPSAGVIPDQVRLVAARVHAADVHGLPRRRPGIVMGHRPRRPRSAICSRGCAMSLPMAATP